MNKKLMLQNSGYSFVAKITRHELNDAEDLLSRSKLYH